MIKGISDIDELVAAFGAGEDANLTLFSYVTEVRAAAWRFCARGWPGRSAPRGKAWVLCPRCAGEG